MKTLHADLTAAQQSSSIKPYLEVELVSRDRATTYTYKTIDTPNRLLDVQWADGRTGGYIYDASGAFNIGAVIQLQNTDTTLDGVDFQGYRMKIKAGANTDSGNKTAPDPAPYIVVSQHRVRTVGVSAIELRAISLWERMMVNKIKTVWNDPKDSYSGATVAEILQAMCGGQLFQSLQVDNGGSWDDVFVFNPDTLILTQNGTGVDDPQALEMAGLPAAPAVNDAVYFGLDTTFDRLSIYIRVAGSGYTITWEYYNGSSWAALSPTDNTTGFTVASFKTVVWEQPSNWAAVSVNGSASLYFVRARVSAITAPSGPTLGLTYCGKDFSFSLDTDEATQGSDNTPNIDINTASDPAATAVAALAASRLGLYTRADGFHAKYIDNSQAVEDYSYEIGGNHNYYSNIESVSLVVPNTVTVASSDPAEDFEPTYHGQDTDDESIASFGPVEVIIVVKEVESDEDAASRAETYLYNLKRDSAQGDAEVPMNVGQEPWDLVEIVDSWATRTVTGRVSQLIFHYKPGEYPRLRIIMGGVVRTAMPSGLSDLILPPGGWAGGRLGDWTGGGIVNWENILPKAVQGFQHDLHFVADDQDTVSWGSGTIVFYDGTSLSIDAGDTGNLADTTVRYIYFDLDDDNPEVLKVATVADYLSGLTEKRGVLCVVQKGSASGINATVIPSHGKEPLITADVIHMAGLLEKDLGGGTKLQAILSTQISAGQILISSSTSFAADYNPTEKFDLGDDTLDSINEGTTYKRLLATDIQAGHIKLTTSTVWSGKVTVNSGVTIDSSAGINIFGLANALTTRATEAGTIQCYVGADGKIYAGAGNVSLDVNGIVLNGVDTTLLEFSHSGANPCFIYEVDGNLTLLSTNPVKCWEDFLPYTTNTYDLGSSSLRWADLHINNIFFDEGAQIYQVGGDLVLYTDGAGEDIYFSPTGNYVVPFADNTHYLGALNLRWKQGFFVDIGFGTYAAKGAEAFAGYITIADKDGNNRKVMVCT